MIEPDDSVDDDSYDGPPPWYELEGSDEPQGEREQYEAAFAIKRRTP